jgi:DNA replication protein DnaC
LFDWRKIPLRFREKTLKDFVPSQTPDPREVIMEALRANKGLFITGVAGTGKTHLAVAAVSEYIPTIDKTQSHSQAFARDVSFEFLPSTEFFFMLKASFSQATGEMEVLRKFTNVKILLIDDVGSEKVTDWSSQMFYTLIDRRYRNMAQTIITSNLSLQKLSDNIDDRISSRIAEMCTIVELKGKDFRVT